MLKANFDWGPLSQADISTIKREIEYENVYNKYKKINKGDIVVDIGSSTGPFICSILENQPSIIYCVEPSTNLLTVLQKNIQEYQDNQSIIYFYNKAIGSLNNISNIFCIDNNKINYENFSTFVKQTNLNKIDFLKIDCEGCEYDIFTQANLEFLQTRVSYIVAEMHLCYPGNRESFLYFRDNILPKFKSVKIESCTKQQLDYGNIVDLSHHIYDNNFINSYNHTIMIYIDNTYSMIELLALSPDDEKLNQSVAKYYFDQGHTASAFTHFLRTAERTNDIDLAYRSLIMGFKCFDKQQNRDFTSSHLLKQAITIDPKRPEAYFYLSKFYEYRKQWYESYTYASIGLALYQNFYKCFEFDDYPGIIGLLFQKAVAAYWWDKIEESRYLFNTILEQYSNVPSNYMSAIEYNLTQIEKKRQNHKIYTNSRYNNLKFKFPNSHAIQQNYSQAYQDIFCLIATNGKSCGTYLEIGAGDPLFGNNTYLLEKNYNWSGISIEINSELVDKFRSLRSNKIICTDGTRINYAKLLNESNLYSSNIDYLQIDCEPPAKTFEILLSIPFHKYKFGIITYEHDYYLDITKTYREKSRNYLRSLGYVLILPNISLDDSTPFEDWWAHPDLIDKEIIDKLTINNELYTNNIESYLFFN